MLPHLYWHRSDPFWDRDVVRIFVPVFRDAWASARDGPEPKSRRVETFDGGTATFMFGPNRARNGYEIVTMYVNPPKGPAGQQGRDAR